MPVRAATLRAVVTRVVGRAGKRVPTAPTVVAMNRIRGFLGEHVREKPTLGELSAMATMSRSHFSYTFHTVLGMPLRDYMRDLRLERAHRLLLTSAMSLTTIAAESGFFDLPHLDKAFRHRLGVAPLEFRHRYSRRVRPQEDRSPDRAEPGGCSWPPC